MKSFNTANRSFQLAITMISATAVVPTLTHAASPTEPLSASPYYLLSEHTDLQTNVSASGEWELAWETNTNGYSSGGALQYFGPNSAVARPTDSGWDFTGAAAGQTIYFSTKSGAAASNRLPYIGFGAEETDSTSVLTYDSADPRLVDYGEPGAHIFADVRGVYGDSSALPGTQRAPAPGSYNVFDGSSYVRPTSSTVAPFAVWVSNAQNSSVDSTDYVPTSAGGHDHYHQAFTAPGFYEIDWQGSAYLPDGTPTASATETFYYYVNDKPAALREKAYLQDRGTVELGETLSLTGITRSDMGRVMFDNPGDAPLAVLLSLASTSETDISALRTYLTDYGLTLDDALLSSGSTFDLALRFDTTIGLSSFEWDFFGGAYQYQGATRDWQLDAIQVAAVPEPASFGLIAIAGLSLLRRKRRA